MGRLGVQYRDIIMRKQYRDYKRAPPKIGRSHGFDTETKKGYAAMMSDEDAYHVPAGLESALSFMTKREYRSTMNWFYNLHFDVQAIFKHDKKTCTSLFRKGITRFKGYTIKYVPKKALVIKKGKDRWAFFDLAQFFKCSLEVAAKKYLGKEVHAFKADRKNLFEKYSLTQIGQYCQSDAQLTQELGELLVRNLKDFGVPTKNPYSPAYIAQEFLLKKENMPTLFDAPKTVSRMAYNSYRGGWFDCYQRGYFKSASTYDLVSAYPSIMADLPDLRDGKWKNDYNPKQYMGFCFAKIKEKKRILNGNPIGLNCKGVNLYPRFDEWFAVFLTYQEVRALESYYHIDVLDSYSFYENKNCRRPFKDYTHKLFDLKESFDKKDFRGQICKMLLNTPYGKMAQLIKTKYGYTISKLTNFVYAAYITAGVRCKIFDTIAEHGLWDDVIQVLTDAVIVKGTARIPDEVGLGAWKCKLQDAECLSIGNGIYSFREKGKVLLNATRGFSNKNDLWNIYTDNKGKAIVKTLRPLSVNECLRRDRYEDIGRFINEAKDMCKDTEIKRLFPKLKPYEFLKTNVDSIPWHTSDLLRMQKMGVKI